MGLSEQDLEQVGEYVKNHLYEWLPQDVLDLNTRIIRVEEALQNQTSMMVERFEHMDERFEHLLHEMDKRFEHVDKRFEDVDKRFEGVLREMDKRFEDVLGRMDERFRAVDHRLSVQQWMIGGGVVLITLMMSLYQFFA